MLLKHYCFTAGHHFDEYRKLNIKNPLFNANGGFLCLGRVWCRARDGSTAIPPVVARIFSGDSTSPLTREARVLAIFEG